MSARQMTSDEMAFFRNLGFLAPTKYSLVKTADRNARRYIQTRNGGWRAIHKPSLGVISWISDPFPDAVSAYVHAELCQWQ